MVKDKGTESGSRPQGRNDILDGLTASKQRYADDVICMKIMSIMQNKDSDEEGVVVAVAQEGAEEMINEGTS